MEKQNVVLIFDRQNVYLYDYLYKVFFLYIALKLEFKSFFDVISDAIKVNITETDGGEQDGEDRCWLEHCTFCDFRVCCQVVSAFCELRFFLIMPGINLY